MPTISAQEYLRANIKAMLEKVGSKEVCDKCGRAVWLMKQNDGKIEAYTQYAEPHFTKCPKQEQKPTTGSKGNER